MGRKSRSKRERKAQGSKLPPTKVEVAESPKPSLLSRLDRYLTLLGFGFLIVCVLVIAPLLAKKRGQSLEAAIQSTIQALEQADASQLYQLAASVRQSRSQGQIEAWLKELGILGLKSARQISLQQSQNQTSVQFSFEQNNQPGIVSLWFLSPRELNLSNNWQLANICRPDLEAHKIAEQFLSYARTGKSQEAESLKQGKTSSAELEAELKQAGQLANISWQGLNTQQQPWLLKGHSGKKVIAFEVYEQPESCSYKLGKLR